VSLVLVGTPGTSVAQSQVSGNFTGYAMGNQNGSSGNQVYTGDFANHSPSYCPNDPAASWAYGSSISLVSPSSILEHSAGGANTYYSWLVLEDLGDLSCSEGNYWADVYFGRHKPSTDSCNCPGSPSPGYCETDYGGYTGNACTDATNWGVVWVTYWTP
jgi:hypothetical protein